MMKITRTIVVVLLCLVVHYATADEVKVDNVTVPQGGQSTVNIILNNPDKTYTAGQMLLTLPEGISAVLNTNGDPVTTKGERMASTGHSIGASHLDDGTDQFTVFSISSEPIPNTEGALFSVTITADASLDVGTELEGTLSNIEMTTTDAVPTLMSSQTFSIVVGEQADMRTVLDENSTVMPVSASNVDVRVKRTIKANEWSTICLPFAMTETQVKEAFGDDVELADFTSWNSDEDDEGNIVNINVNFTDVTAIEANHPYIIKVSADVDEFIVDGVDIEPDEEPSVQVGKKKAERGYFIGTFVAGAEIPENDLFLSGNKFWYSAGLTKSKAFRAYFEFADVLTDIENAGNSIRISFEDVTSVRLQQERKTKSGVTYNIQGQRVQKPVNGIYIIDGKKVLTRQ